MGDNKGLIFALVALFLVGWIANDVFDFLTNVEKERPFSFNSNEVKSPGDWIQEDQIKIRDRAIILMIKNATWSTFTDTNSMDPVFDSASHAIKLVPKDDSELEIGDIISYKTEVGIVIHRIIDIGKDSEGV